MKSKLSTSKSFEEHLKEAKKMTDKEILESFRKQGYSFEFLRGAEMALRIKR